MLGLGLGSVRLGLGLTLTLTLTLTPTLTPTLTLTLTLTSTLTSTLAPNLVITARPYPLPALSAQPALPRCCGFTSCTLPLGPA